MPKGQGLVLVIDDEADLSDATAQMLVIAGFEALTAEDGRAGLALYDARASDVRLVLLDLSMPVMSGEETFRELHRRDPNLPIVLCSGFDATELRQRFADQGVAGFLQKPYTPAQLFEAIRSCLPSPLA
jgi:two-component system cell cycle sensor histidine kinase/response regulator CckA